MGSPGLPDAVALRNAVLEAWREEGFAPVTGRWHIESLYTASLKLRCDGCAARSPDWGYSYTQRVTAGPRQSAKWIAAEMARKERDVARLYRRAYHCLHLYSFALRASYYERRMAARVGLILLEAKVFGGAP